MDENTLQQTSSDFGNTIRVTVQQWAHIVQGHDYMSGNPALDLEAFPSQILLLKVKPEHPLP
ncbi:MAG: hypothetical protein OHK0046_41160 [Anaerolineae bacterium]